MNTHNTSETQWRAIARRHPSAFLLAAQLVSLVLYAVLDGSPNARVLLNAFGVVILALVVWVIGRSATIRWVTWLLVAPAFVLSLLSVLFTDPALLMWSSLLEAAVYFYAAGGLIAYMMGDMRVTSDELFAAGATFTLLAWGFAHSYVVCQAWLPGSFVGAAGPGQPLTFLELLSLSFTNLSATGLSDILPVTLAGAGAGHAGAVRRRGLHCRGGLSVDRHDPRTRKGEIVAPLGPWDSDGFVAVRSCARARRESRCRPASEPSQTASDTPLAGRGRGDDTVRGRGPQQAERSGFNAQMTQPDRTPARPATGNHGLTGSVRLCLVLTALTALIAARIALTTPFDHPPDEFVHLDAFHYFETNWWPPDLNADGLIYSPAGWSRVYTGELVYLVYGKIGALARLLPFGPGAEPPPLAPAQPGPFLSFLPLLTRVAQSLELLPLYRMLNVALLVGTLLVLALTRGRGHWTLVLGSLLLCLPQVVYVYSYANSDAWGLTACLLLFAFIVGSRVTLGGAAYGAVLGALTGLVLLSKETYWLALSWAAVLVGARWLEQRAEPGTRPTPRQVAASIIAVAATLLVVVTPLKIVYPLSQGDWRAGTEQMRETRAWVAFRPSDPTSSGYRLAARGYPVTAVAADPRWYEVLAQEPVRLLWSPDGSPAGWGLWSWPWPSLPRMCW